MNKTRRPIYTCQFCGKEFTTTYSLASRPSGPPKFCNQDCYRAYRTSTKKNRLRKPATCHPDRPHVGLGLCGPCYGQQHRKTHKEDYLLSARRYNLKKSYGLSEEDYHKMYDSQQGICPICESHFERWFLGVDHSHETGKIRDLLCQQCNSGLGCYQDSVETMKKAVAYLERHRQ